MWDGENAPLAARMIGKDGFIPESEKITATPEQITGGIAGSLAEFLHALRTGQTPQGECHDNIKSLAMVFGAVESAQTGRRVMCSYGGMPA
jgi:predicted dehydrogenase